MTGRTFSWLETSGLANSFAQAPVRRWLVTGGAGFIGSHLAETLLHLGQSVRVLDNFATGYEHNIEAVCANHAMPAEGRFELIRGDIRDAQTCEAACRDIDIVLHQAALGSVPRSIADPLTTNAVNVGGFLNMLNAARLAGVSRFVYAASSSTYGDEPNLPKQEDRIGNPLSPYAVTKLVDEFYAAVFARTYDFASIGLRYFNVFGPRQDPNGSYAAVIPKWAAAMIGDGEVVVNGDGLNSRDFCYVANAVQANLRAALAPDAFQNQVYNVAVGDQTSLLELFELIRGALAQHQIYYSKEPRLAEPRKGDVRHSLADISKAGQMGYRPTHRLAAGINESVAWYVDELRRQHPSIGE